LEEADGWLTPNLKIGKKSGTVYYFKTLKFHATLAQHGVVMLVALYLLK